MKYVYVKIILRTYKHLRPAKSLNNMSRTCRTNVSDDDNSYTVSKEDDDGFVKVRPYEGH